MIIDFHAHGFPDKIAERAVQQLEEHYKVCIPHQGTLAGLLRSADEAGVGRLVLHTAATKPSQVELNNDWAAKLASKRIIPFGSIHPKMRNPVAEVRRIRQLRLPGVKLHADFQGFPVDEPTMWPVYDAIGDDLMVMFHVGDEHLDNASPSRVARVLDAFPRMRAILAHLGGYARWEEAKRTVIGRPVYLDTSSTFWRLPLTEARQIIHSHGVERVLFGTDYPIASHVEELERLHKVGLTMDENLLIMGGNASRLLADISAGFSL